MPCSMRAAAVRDSIARGTGTRFQAGTTACSAYAPICMAAGTRRVCGVGADLQGGAAPVAALETLDVGTHRLDHSRPFGAGRQGKGQLVESRAMGDGDVGDAGRRRAR